MGEKRDMLFQLNMPFYPVRRPWVASEPLLPAMEVDGAAYVGALRREVEATVPDYEDDYALDAVWVGGLPWSGGMDCSGLALHLADTELGNLLREVRLSPVAQRADGRPVEVTLTGHPGMVAVTALDAARRAHAARLWVDYATSNGDEASKLGRFMGPEAMEVTAMVLGDHVRRGDVELGIGLAAGLPGQTVRSACTTVEAALRYGATWVGVDELPVVQGASCPSAASVAELRAAMAGRLVREGFAEYVPGQWALPGHESRFLVQRAAGVEMLGFGAGATTAVDGMGARNTSDLATYLRFSDDPSRTIADSWRL